MSQAGEPQENLPASANQIQTQDSLTFEEVAAEAARSLIVLPEGVEGPLLAFARVRLTSQQEEYALAALNIDRLIHGSIEQDFKRDLMARSDDLKQLLTNWNFHSAYIQVIGISFGLIASMLTIRLAIIDDVEAKKARIEKLLEELDALIKQLEPPLPDAMQSVEACGQLIDELFTNLLGLASRF